MNIINLINKSLSMALFSGIQALIRRVKDRYATHIIDTSSDNHKYKILKRYSSRRACTKYLVQSEITGIKYMCKRYETRAIHTNDYFIKKMHGEYSIAGNLSHKNIIKFCDLIKHNDKWYLLIEHCENGSLYEKCKKGLSCTETEDYFLQLIDGIDYLHSKGIAHRDIRLENLLIDKNNVLKISNFSSADMFKVIHEYEKRKSRGNVGANPYKAPEILLQESYDGEAADIWSCGIVLHAMLFRCFPFKRAHASHRAYVQFMVGLVDKYSYCARLISPLHWLIQKMLQPNPEKRARLSKVKNCWWLDMIRERQENMRKRTENRELKEASKTV